MGPQALAQVLRPLHNLFTAEQYPSLLVGLEISDDAAVYRINGDVAIIQTLDFFTPVVDDPYDYGAIAAANAMSDVYAMGGEVVLALNICGFPPDLSLDIVSEILRGGAEKVAEAGGAVAGGHTVDDVEPKYGMSVMGVVHPDRVLTKAAARPGDVLILTKPLGVGIITTVLKARVAEAAHVGPAIEKLLSDRDPMVRRSTCQSLWGVPSTPGVDQKLIELSRGPSKGGSSEGDHTIYYALSTRPLIRKPVAERLIELIYPKSLHTSRVVWGLSHHGATDDAQPAIIAH